MFREMRRKKQKLAEEECRAIIERANSGVMGVIGDDGYPYTVPVNPFLMGNKLYFHSAKAGHKIDAIAKEPMVSREFTTYFRSVQVFGKAHIVTDEEERQKAFRAFCERYCSDDMDRYDEIMAKEAKAALIVCVDIEHISGKEAMELVKQRG